MISEGIVQFPKISYLNEIFSANLIPSDVFPSLIDLAILALQTNSRPNLSELLSAKNISRRQSEEVFNSLCDVLWDQAKNCRSSSSSYESFVGKGMCAALAFLCSNVS